MFEFAVLLFFLGATFTFVLARGAWLRRRDRKQEEWIDGIARAARGQSVERLFVEFGDPYEIEHGTTGRALYVWKFPPARSKPMGSGLFVLTVVTDGGVAASHEWKRQVQHK